MEAARVPPPAEDGSPRRATSTARFAIPPGDDSVFTEGDQQILRDAYLCERAYRPRILAAPPCSEERARILSDLYSELWKLARRLSNLTGYTDAQEPDDRSTDAQALLNLTGPRPHVVEIGVGAGALSDALAYAGALIDGKHRSRPLPPGSE